MKSSIFISILQGVMIFSLLGVFTLLILPMLPIKALHGPARAASHVLDLNSSVSSEQRLAINRAKKIIESSHGRDKIEFVLTGNGIPFLFDNSPYRDDIVDLIKEGVTFTACENSIQKIFDQLRRNSTFIDGVQFVADGNIYSEKLKESGYTDEFA